MLCVEYELCLVTQSTAPWTVAHQATAEIFQGRILEWVTISFFRRSSQPGIKLPSPECPVLAADTITLKLPGKPNICVEYISE